MSKRFGDSGKEKLPFNRKKPPAEPVLFSVLFISPAPLNMNHYANKKSAAESMLDVALLMANASQLKAVLEQGPSFHFYTPTITLISISLCLQITVGVLLIFIVRWNLNDEQKHQRLNFMENLATGLVFIIVVVNVFITAFGVHRTNYSN
uniref:Ninjurin 1 n=1 Tax=Neolamprologus brichardi TaxID=32507 RepID=A0A3Q4I3V6_NEOBR